MKFLWIEDIEGIGSIALSQRTKPKVEMYFLTGKFISWTEYSLISNYQSLTRRISYLLLKTNHSVLQIDNFTQNLHEEIGQLLAN